MVVGVQNQVTDPSVIDHASMHHYFLGKCHLPLSNILIRHPTPTSIDTAFVGFASVLKSSLQRELRRCGNHLANVKKVYYCHKPLTISHFDDVIIQHAGLPLGGDDQRPFFLEEDEDENLSIKTPRRNRHHQGSN